MGIDLFLLIVFCCIVAWWAHSGGTSATGVVPIPDGYRLLWSGFSSRFIDVWYTYGAWGVYQTPQGNFCYIHYEYRSGELGEVNTHEKHKSLEGLPEDVLRLCPEHIRRDFGLTHPRSDNEKRGMQLKKIVENVRTRDSDNEGVLHED